LLCGPTLASLAVADVGESGKAGIIAVWIFFLKKSAFQRGGFLFFLFFFQNLKPHGKIFLFLHNNFFLLFFFTVIT